MRCKFRSSRPSIRRFSRLVERRPLVVRKWGALTGNKNFTTRLSPLMHVRGTLCGAEGVRLDRLGEDKSSVFQKMQDIENSTEKLKKLLEFGKKLESFPESQQTVENRVMGCTTKTYLSVNLMDGCVEFTGTSDSELTKGLIWILIQTLSSRTVDEILEFEAAELAEVIQSPGVLTPSRTNGFLNLVETLKRQTRLLHKSFQKFPSLIIQHDHLKPIGAFAEAQAQFLNPGQQSITMLAEKLKSNKVGVVAHFYMDPEVQGLLTAASEIWPHILIADSISMPETAVTMVEQGCEHIAVLGVDFMSENVRVVLDRSGCYHIPVYRMSEDLIGCSLAEAADSISYEKYLKTGSPQNKRTLHVVYINTSLEAKAKSQAIVPTITCTSSNVLQTLLQSFSQIEDLNVLYGPDTYMGQNIYNMFKKLLELTDDEISQLHPAHNRNTIQSLLNRFHYFEDGICIVHHLFGGEVCQTVKEAYGDAYITAHFEVPGEMFSLALDARKRGMGVIGSTSNILNYIKETVQNQLEQRTTDRLQFVLGTESGMITSIVHAVQTLLHEESSLHDLEVEIVFPVASSAITTTSQKTESTVMLPNDFVLVPGAASGEGCAMEGGCANCPYMKMNTLKALEDIIDKIGESDEGLEVFYPKECSAVLEVNGEEKPIQDLGTEPILEMRHFQKYGVLSEKLVESVLSKT